MTAFTIPQIPYFSLAICTKAIKGQTKKENLLCVLDKISLLRYLWHARCCNIVCGNICVVYRNMFGLKIYIYGLKIYICRLKNILVD